MSDDDRTERGGEPLDDQFVAGAAFHEPSAHDRAREAQRRTRDELAAQRRKRKSTGRKQRWAGRRRPLVAIAFFAVVVLAVAKFSPGSDANATGVRRPNHVTVYYAVPSNVPVDPDMPDRIRHDIDVIQAWFAGKTDGNELRIDDHDGVIDVRTKLLDATTADLQVEDAENVVRDEFRKDGKLPNTIVLAYVPVFRQLDCGQGSADGFAAVWVGSCNQSPTSSSLWGGGATVTAAHELFHAMGAVAKCAPHYSGEGHVTDSLNDLMDDGAERGNDLNLELDIGNDDYYDVEGGGCTDVADHPAWRPAS